MKESRKGHNNSNLSSLPCCIFFFLRRGYSECQLCSAAALCTVLQRSHPCCTPSTPIELPALVINSEPCAVTAGLCTQQLAAGRQALFHRLCPPISCTQLSSGSPTIQSTAAAAGEGGLFHCCHWPRSLESPSSSLYFLF